MKESRAAALKYESGDYAPKVLARGIGQTADVLRRLAGESGVPVLESPELAASLSRLQPFDYVPEKYWIAVAEILKFVYETRGTNELHKD